MAWTNYRKEEGYMAGDSRVSIGRHAVRNAILPLHGFDIWSIGYLMAHGFEHEQLPEVLCIASRPLVGGLDGAPVDCTRYRSEFASVSGSREAT